MKNENREENTILNLLFGSIQLFHCFGLQQIFEFFNTFGSWETTRSNIDASKVLHVRTFEDLKNWKRAKSWKISRNIPALLENF